MSDLISRQTVLDLLQMKYSGKELYKAIYELPSVENKGEPEDAFAEEAEETKEMTNEEMLNKVLRNFFPRALFIREINEASHTKKIIFSDEWLIKPYRGGE